MRFIGPRKHQAIFKSVYRKKEDSSDHIAYLFSLLLHTNHNSIALSFFEFCFLFFWFSLDMLFMLSLLLLFFLFVFILLCGLIFSSFLQFLTYLKYIFCVFPFIIYIVSMNKTVKDIVIVLRPVVHNLPNSLTASHSYICGNDTQK